MVRKTFFSVLLIFFLMITFSGNNIFGLFNSNAANASNSFTTAPVFPTPTPSIPPEQQFPDCPITPGANVNGKAWNIGYVMGWHWIIFEGMKYGSDYVYYLEGKHGKDKVLQCYYPIPITSRGIQTNWLKKNNHLNGFQEWENGQDFGLNKGKYQVQNLIFSLELPSSTPEPTSAASTQPTSTPTSSPGIIPSPIEEPSTVPTSTPEPSPITEETESSSSADQIMQLSPI